LQSMHQLGRLRKGGSVKELGRLGLFRAVSLRNRGRLSHAGAGCLKLIQPGADALVELTRP
jgi:hypothetical protein